MKKLFIMALALALCVPAWSEVKFKDVPADHWAAQYVYDLVKLGITTGYPDGTFRGQKNITRYETAIFLSKLAQKLGGEDMAAVKADLNAIKTEINALKKNSSGALINGTFEMNTLLANVLATSGITGNGPVINYRLQSSLNHEFSEGNTVKVGLDTMDNGYYGGNHDLVREMFDVEARIKVNPMDLGVMGDVMSHPLEVGITAGPGVVQHQDATGFLSSEAGICYIRPDTGFSVSTKLWDLDATGGYMVGGYDPVNSGKIDTNYFYGTLGYDIAKVPVINNLKIIGEGSTYIKNPNSNGPKDLRAKLTLASNINPKVVATGYWGLGKRESSGWMVGGELGVRDFIGPGGTLLVRGSKIGSEYVPDLLWAEEIGETGYDIFMRPLLNGTVNLDAEFAHPLVSRILLKGKGAMRMSSNFGYGADQPNSLLTGQLGLLWAIAADAAVDAFYRVEQDPTVSETTDFACLGLNYKF